MIKKNSPIKFVRLSGAGNTFAVCNILGNDFNRNRSELANQVCSKMRGLSSDGLIFIQTKSGYDFEWDFYNSDGSSAEMCGNAARCVARYYFEFVEAKPIIRFLTQAGEIIAKVQADNSVQVQMPKAQILQDSIEVMGQLGSWLNTGVPHFVVRGPANLGLAKALRSNEFFGKSGTNVTFVEERPGFLNAVTYERGVEDFTPACGTGAVAASLAIQITKPALQHFVHMPGGELTVEWNAALDRAQLQGDATLDFQFELFNEK